MVITAEHLGLDPKTVKAKMLDIDIKKKTMKVGVKGKEPLISGDLHQAVKLENSMWTLGAKTVLFTVCEWCHAATFQDMLQGV